MPNIVYALCAILFGMRCAFADSVSKHTLHVWQGRRVFRLLRVQSGSKITEDGEARRNILENTFEAALLRVDSTVHLRCSLWLRQQGAMFLELIPTAEAQQIGWLDSAHSPLSWRHFHWYVCCCWTESCLWYWNITGKWRRQDPVIWMFLCSDRIFKDVIYPEEENIFCLFALILSLNHFYLLVVIFCGWF